MTWFHCRLIMLITMTITTHSENVGHIVYSQKSLENFRTGTSQLLNITICYNFKAKSLKMNTVIAKVEMNCASEYICSTVNGTLLIEMPSNETFCHNASVNLTANFIGHTTLDTLVTFSYKNVAISTFLEEQLTSYEIAILRSKKGRVLSKMFSYFVGIFVLVNTFMMGTQLDIKVIINVIKKPIGPIIGFLCQYAAMPLIAFIWANALLAGFPALQFGYFANGCCPGGGQSNVWTILFNGNIDLSATMTFCSIIAAFAMMPVWLFTLGQKFLEGRVSIPFGNLLATLLLFIVPCLVGMLFIYFKPHLIHRFHKIIKVSSLVMVFVFAVFGIYANFYAFYLMTWRTVIAGAMLPWTGYAVSLLITTLLKQPFKDRITIAIETGIQNGVIAMLICKLSLPEPDSDLTMVMPICVVIFTTVPLMLILVVKTVIAKLTTHSDKIQSVPGTADSVLINSI